VRQQGKEPRGFLAPTLYELSAGVGFRDITSGSNGAFQAGPGWDPVTGLGVPDVSALIQHAGTVGQQGGPVGHYTVTGHLGDSSYSGDVVVDQIGNTYHVAWTIAGTTYAGIGISDGTNLAVGYRSGDAIGVAYYTPSNLGLSGIWAYENGNTVGTETWTRK